MFRSFLSTILLIAFAIQSFHMGGIVVDYYMNTAAYAKNCENKAKPVLKCNGKCQMAKKILEEQKKEEQVPDRKLDRKIQLIWCKANFASLTFLKSVLSRSETSFVVTPKPSPHLDAIFHPPCLV